MRRTPWRRSSVETRRRSLAPVEDLESRRSRHAIRRIATSVVCQYFTNGLRQGKGYRSTQILPVA